MLNLSSYSRFKSSVNFVSKQQEVLRKPYRLPFAVTDTKLTVQAVKKDDNLYIQDGSYSLLSKDIAETNYYLQTFSIYLAKAVSGSVSVLLVKRESNNSWHQSLVKAVDTAIDKPIVLSSNHESECYEYNIIDDVIIPTITQIEAETALNDLFSDYVIEGKQDLIKFGFIEEPEEEFYPPELTEYDLSVDGILDDLIDPIQPQSSFDDEDIDPEFAKLFK
ncbi:hypothetical protein [Photobacterium carnosum]|uniref:hypothetical protein n=1 Tax=Photobacterium carnosum TaxID=2023717 RepID=UPI001E34815D|nr:hypothetical protein [Photobacterium carnosum]MCD9517036.1 hypothetical protein [Photobacterium carnosum]